MFHKLPDSGVILAKKKQLTKCSPTKVSPPYSCMITGLLNLLCQAVASFTTFENITSMLPSFEYQAL